MYTAHSHFVLGFHGCDKEVQESVLQGKMVLEPSKNDYDWLGHGVYFWEHDPSRAQQWAEELKRRKKIRTPAVLGAVIDLGRCLNLMNYQHLDDVRVAYRVLEMALQSIGEPMPVNADVPGSKDLLVRKLDCAVIQMLHTVREHEGQQEYHTVRALFTEGAKLYPNAGFNEKNHIQLCVRNQNCIKGYFLPLEKHDGCEIP